MHRNRTRTLTVVAAVVLGGTCLCSPAQAMRTPDNNHVFQYPEVRHVKKAEPATTAVTTGRCNWLESQLPRTPDAVEGWYASCEEAATV